MQHVPDRLVLTLLGGFQARLEPGHKVPVRTKKGQALLAYLACRPGESHPRGKLAALLWADTDDSSARHNLRQTLCTLRAALAASGSEAIHSETDCIALDAERLAVDVVTFE